MFHISRGVFWTNGTLHSKFLWQVCQKNFHGRYLRTTPKPQNKKTTSLGIFIAYQYSQKISKVKSFPLVTSQFSWKLSTSISVIENFYWLWLWNFERVREYLYDIERNEKALRGGEETWNLMEISGTRCWFAIYSIKNT